MIKLLFKIPILVVILLINSSLYAQQEDDIKYVATTLDDMDGFNLYPSYDVYIQMMQRFAGSYPEICSLVEIGESVEKRKILAVKISDNVHDEEYHEPEFFYSSTIHGNETTGFNLMLRLIDYLLKNYGTDSYVTKLVDNVQIYINPLANPDGTYHFGNEDVEQSTRYNANGIDLNRSFPEIGKELPGHLEPEVKCMVEFAENHYFSISANLHGGSEILNYPWDSFYANELPLPDDYWFRQVCAKYVDSAREVDPEYMVSTISPSGYVFGSEWYKISGGRQDYMNYYRRCREITIELSNIYVLDPEYLEDYWQKNREPFLNYIGETLNGVTGIVTDIYGNEIKDAEIVVMDKDKPYTTVFTNDGGYYFRHLPTDSLYEIAVYADGYKTVNQVVKTEKDNLVVLNFMLQRGESNNPLPTVGNPENEYFTAVSCYGGMLEISSSRTIHKVDIVAVDGRAVAKFYPETCKTEYHLNNCTQGIYVIKADCEGRTFTQKIYITK
ncbi:MAG: carboxypeptidase regulatory-like domain-containing protein [Bacteroidales bacterium]|nr:carboxypeptidase regulatory-like domain-containing protein [Bacteroidales bacterium]